MTYKDIEKRKKYNRDYQQKNKDKIQQKHREWIAKHKEWQKEYHKEYNKNWYQENKEKRSLQIKQYAQGHKEDSVKRVQAYVKRHPQRVKDYGKKFEQTNVGKYRQLSYRAKKWTDEIITIEDFKKIISNPCFYCGDTGKVGVDRVNNLKGYSLNNSVSCCKLCNFMKKTMTREDFLNHIEKIYTFNNIK